MGIAEYAIRTNRLTLRYGTRRGIEDVSLRVPQSSIFGFLGPNGAGKSTTIRILLGFLRRFSGDATVAGADCRTDTVLVRKRVGYVPGDVRLYPWLTLRSGLQIVSEMRHQPETLRTGLELAELFAVEPDLAVRKMSRGNRQKVALALALAPKPEVLILDEPTSGLDPIMQSRLIECLHRHRSDGGTVLFSSHTLAEVESACDHVAIIRDGRIVEQSETAELRLRASREVIIDFDPGQATAGLNLSDLPTGLQFAESSEYRIRGVLTGEAGSLIQWAADRNASDISIGAPSLESLFHRYYEDAPPANPPGSLAEAEANSPQGRAS